MTELRYLSSAKNFNACSFSSTPEAKDSKVTSRLLVKHEVFPALDHSSRILVFGDYDIPTDRLDSVTYIDFPTSSTESRPRFHPIFVDNWATTIDEFIRLVKSDHSNSPWVWLLTSEYLGLLSDPRPILLAFKKLVLIEKCNVQIRFIFTTNFIGVRSWKIDEFEAFIRASGFEIYSQTLIGSCVIFDAGITSGSYQNFLGKTTCFSALVETDFLLISYEDFRSGLNQEVSSFVETVKSLNPYAISLCCDLNKDTPRSDGRTIFYGDILPSPELNEMLNGSALLDAVRLVLFLFPNIKVIEVSDSFSLGFRLVQGKKTGMLPQCLVLRCFLHGNWEYLKHQLKEDIEASDFSFNQLHSIVKDHYIFREADECWVSSLYLKNLLVEEFGHHLSIAHVQNPPFDLSRLNRVSRGALKTIKKLVFFENNNLMGCFQDFVEAVEGLDSQSLDSLESIVYVGMTKPKKGIVERLRKFKSITYVDLNDSKLLGFIVENQTDALFVIPAEGVSYSETVLVSLLAGSRFLVYGNGGTESIVDDIQFSELFFCKANPIILREKIRYLLKVEPELYSKIIKNSQMKVWEVQEKVNEFFKETKSFVSQCRVFIDYVRAKDISLVTPVYNTNIGYLETLFQSIQIQSIKPKEWIIVDDGSRGEYSDSLRQFAYSCREFIDVRVVRQENKGAAGAKNTGLKASKSYYTCFIDSDDVFLPWTLSDLVCALEVNSRLALVSGFCLMFLSRDLRELAWFSAKNLWKPMGIPEVRSLSISHNDFLTANVLLRTSEVSVIGGWEETKDCWEDYAFYTKLAWMNIEFSLMPITIYLYRDTPASISKTHNKYFGKRRLVRNMYGFTRLDALVLQNLIRSTLPIGLSRKERLLLETARKLYQWSGMRLMFRLVAPGLKRILGIV